MKKQHGPTPLVVGDMGWVDAIPDWLRTEVEAERMAYGLAEIMGRDVPKVGTAEVCAYLMTAALSAPLTHEYTEVYMYITAELMQKRGAELEPFMQEKLEQGLTEWEQRELDELKSDIYRKRGGEVSNPLLDTMRDFKKAIDNVPKGMETQETLTGTPMQVFFSSNEPKKKGEIINPNKKTRNREKKGSNNLATFGIQDPQLPSLQDCMEILEEGKENREKCCERLITAEAIGKDARETGEFDKVCSDCKSCGEEVPE